MSDRIIDIGVYPPNIDARDILARLAYISECWAATRASHALEYAVTTREAADALASSQEEIERLRKALEPFARARGHFDSYVRDEDTVDIALRHIRAHHVFAAARALSHSEEQATDSKAGKL
ncbi:hypothetical protein LB579_32475 [Mesorhizobium sp. BR1-1-7]|uniref:hypothetical protein n=1 Tax=Mesorhizobium sp. BR1-1-7 TaxID=2876647 RepID=UPI001CD00D0B|nr:hypothetical protein [Mesorhizobium sp. BR1-1-7]MBZ9922383.1 hypothetical protein [Mesorhizobium sp. BR1-1-7]